jgi:oxalate decarboxylase
MVQIADRSNFKASKTVAAAIIPFTRAEMHWHPNADEWQHFISGQGELTVFNTGPEALTQNFNPGDIGYVKRAYSHYIKNTGNTDLVYLEVFRSSYYSDVSLSDWLARTPRAMVAQHLNIEPATAARFPNSKPVVVSV